MSIPDVMQRCLRTAGVPSNAAPVSSNMGVYPDGTIALFMLYKPGPPHREGKDRLRSSAGMRQLGSASAGKSQLHNNSSAGSRQPSPHHQESTHRSHSSAGMRQPSVTSAGKSQLLITSTAGSRQPSPQAFLDSSANTETSKYVHSKKRTPSQCRRSARRRAAWRLSLKSLSDCPKDHPSTVQNPAVDIDQSGTVSKTDNSNPVQNPAVDIDQSGTVSLTDNSHPVQNPAVDIDQSGTASLSVGVLSSDDSPARDLAGEQSIPPLDHYASSADFERWKASISAELETDPLFSLLLADSWEVPALDDLARNVALDEIERQAGLTPGYLVRCSSIRSAPSMWRRIARYFNIIT